MLLLALLGALLTLLAGQALKVRSDRLWLAGFTERLLEHADSVAATTHLTLGQLRMARTAACSDEDLAYLRIVAFNSRFLRDVDRLHDGAITCSATWGRFVPPRPMPPPNLTHGRMHWWTAIRDPAEPRLVADFAAFGDAFVVTSPTAFDSYAHIDPDIGALVVTRDGGHRYRTFGQTDRMVQDAAEADYGLGSVRHARMCSRDYDLCVVTRMRRSSLLEQSLPASVGLCLLGGLVGGGAGVARMLYRRYRRSLPVQLRRALARDGLTMHYQPLRRIADRSLVGAEVLAR